MPLVSGARIILFLSFQLSVTVQLTAWIHSPKCSVMCWVGHNTLRTQLNWLFHCESHSSLMPIGHCVW